MLHTVLSPYLYLFDSEKTQLSMLLQLFLAPILAMNCFHCDVQHTGMVGINV